MCIILRESSQILTTYCVELMCMISWPSLLVEEMTSIIYILCFREDVGTKK